MARRHAIPCSWDSLEFIYDDNGLVGFKHNGTDYLYRKNLSGDITHILDKTGNVLVKYNYDAWGRHATSDDSGKDLGRINPFRYRGYYYDEETGLYYLQSRYYDPAVGRFINADEVSKIDPESIGGLNLFAYCGNNPIARIDPLGDAWWDWALSGLATIGGAALCFVPGAQMLGAGLVVAGVSGLASCTMEAAGVDSKVASQISAGIDIVGGAALMVTPFAPVGASMIGAGVGSFAGGYISEAVGGSYQFGSTIGSIAGGQVYKGLTTAKLYRSVGMNEANSILNTGKFSVGAGQMEGKYFATNKANAIQWGAKLGSDKIASTRVAKSALSNPSVEYFNYRLDSIGPAYYFSDMNYLNAITKKIRVR